MELNKEKLSNFIEEHCAGTKNYHEITKQIKETEIKHFSPKIPKFCQQLNAFVYGHLTKFPRSNIEYKPVTTSNFLRNVYKILKIKTHLHHSHTTGEILGYAHDFFNWKVRENKTEFSCITHNFFEFDMYFFIREYRATTWNSKNLNIGGTGLTRINFANIGNTHKFIDKLKYYQQSLSQLTKTATEEEKEAIKKSDVQYIANMTILALCGKNLTFLKKLRSWT